MDRIKVKILNPEAIHESEKMMVCAARLTQCGHKIKGLNDFIELYEKPYTEETVKTMASLPHPTIQKFGVINIVVIGASRRFLAQITRHQNEVKFMSASLQYSDYSDNTGNEDFVVPYNLLGRMDEYAFLNVCTEAMKAYKQAVDFGADNDSAGYMAPQALRNVLIISATPYQWKHMISQRICRRNTDETRYVMLSIWEQLYALSPAMFGNCGAFCMNGPCKEGKMICGATIDMKTPKEILNVDFSDLPGMPHRGRK